MAKMPVIEVDVSEAKAKLDEVILKLEKIHQLINKSWLLKLIFYGFKGNG